MPQLPNFSRCVLCLCALLLAMALTACQDSTTSKEQAQNQADQTQALKIGAVLRLSKGASDGLPARHGIEIAVQEINSQGGIDGRPLEVVYYDSKDDATTAVNAVQKLISVDKVEAIIGPMMSGNVLAAAPLCQRNNVVLLTPTGTSPRISEAGSYTFRLCSRIDDQARALVQEALSRVGTDPTVAILYSNEPYGKGSKELFTRYLAEQDITPATVESFQRGDKDFQAQLTKIKQLNPDILFVPGYLQETAPLISQARQMGIDALSVGVFGDMAPKYIELAGKAAEGHLIAGEYNKHKDTERNQDFVNAYEALLEDQPKAPENIMFAALTYDAVHLLRQSFSTGATTGSAIQSFLDELEAFDGITGTLSFDANGDVQKGGVYLFEVQNGTYRKL